jgi:hypothetical protein
MVNPRILPRDIPMIYIFICKGARYESRCSAGMDGNNRVRKEKGEN